MTSYQVYLKIMALSKKYLSGRPPIHISSIAHELSISNTELHQHLDKLIKDGFIEFNDDVVRLTDTGHSSDFR